MMLLVYTCWVGVEAGGGMLSFAPGMPPMPLKAELITIGKRMVGDRRAISTASDGSLERKLPLNPTAAQLPI